MLKSINLTALEWGTEFVEAGFVRVNARRYLRVTSGDVVQRVELRPNSHGGQLTCDLTIHPLWAREHLTLDVLEPGVWIGHLCERYGLPKLIWYDRSTTGVTQMMDAIMTGGISWFDETASAEGIVESAAVFPDPWRNEQQVHVELGHSLLRVGRFDEAQQVFDRKPKRVPQYRTITRWIASARVELPGRA